MAKMGRKTKLTPETQQIICEELKVHGLLYAAANRAGISRQSVLNWMKWGEKAKSGKYFNFFCAVKNALEEFKRANVIRIVKAANDGTWQASAWMLERKFPDEFAIRHQLEVSGDPKKPIKLEVMRTLSDEQLLKIAGINENLLEAEYEEEEEQDGGSDS